MGHWFHRIRATRTRRGPYLALGTPLSENTSGEMNSTTSSTIVEIRLAKWKPLIYYTAHRVRYTKYTKGIS